MWRFRSPMRRRAAQLFFACAALVGCYRDFTIAPRGGIDAGPRHVDAGFREPLGTCISSAGVDLLFVVDNSASMLATQMRLSGELPNLIRMLNAPPDFDGDGEPDWDPITDLQVGVVATDMGGGPHMPPTCTETGDDGRLRTSSGVEECFGTYPPFVRFGSEPTDVALMELSCLIQPGNTGCGFEQPLEAWLKALSPAAPTSYTSPFYVPPTFLSGTGHGAGANALFVRENTLLAVVVVTDEDDCSVLDLDLFDPDSARYAGAALNLRCSRFPQALFPMERYVEGLLALRAGRPDLVAFAAIVGIPRELAVAEPQASDFRAMLEDPRMEERADPAMPDRLAASCQAPDGSSAFPPRRLVRMSAALGAGRSTVQSICESDLTTHVIPPIAQLIARRACEERTLP